MSHSCRCIIHGLHHKGYITDAEYEKLLRNVGQRKKGNWELEIRGGQAYFICSKCGEDVNVCGYDFCPNCGADMRGEENE